MIEIPVNKALAAVEEINGCQGCFFSDGATGAGKNCPEYTLNIEYSYLPCKASDRKDKTGVIYKLVTHKARI